MCLLMMKPSGVVYNHELLLRAIESGLVTNKDGIGGAVRKSSSNILRMNKGHFNHSKNDFYSWLKSQDIQPEDEVLVHLRWGTNGSKTIYNQHPYILGEKSTMSRIGIVSELSTEDDDVKTGVFAHNGIFSGHDYESYDANLSDTYNWGLSYFRSEKQIQALKAAPHALIATNLTLGNSLKGEKVCFMFPDRKMIVLGNFIDDRGYLFSNSGYKSYTEDRGGSSSRGLLNKFHNLIDDEDDSEECPSFCGINTGFNLSDRQTRFNFSETPDEQLYNDFLERTSVKDSFEEAVIVADSEPVEEVEVISKAQVATVRKLVNSSFEYELKLPKIEVKIIPIAKHSNKTDHFNNKYNNRSNLKLGPLDKVIKVTAKDDEVLNSKYRIAADFSLPIKITSENSKHFTVTNIYTENRGIVSFTPSSHFTIGAVTLDSVYLRGTILGEAGINDDDYTEYLIRTHDQIGNNFNIRPKHSMIPVYRDYMKLVERFGSAISLNKSKTLRNLTSSITTQINKDKATKGIVTDRVYQFVKNHYNGIALVEFYNNFVKDILDAKASKKLNLASPKESLFNEPYSLVDNHLDRVIY